jgi:hypothetical protein
VEEGNARQSWRLTLAITWPLIDASMDGTFVVAAQVNGGVSWQTDGRKDHDSAV